MIMELTPRRPTPVPHAATAQRPDWSELPLALQASLETAVGATVVQAVSQRSGFTPGFAARLRLSDGRGVFAKAGSSEYPWLLDALDAEATKITLLPAGVPVAPLLHDLSWSDDDRTWRMLIMKEIDGAPPARPWTDHQAQLAIEAVNRGSQLLDPAPSGYAWGTLLDDLDGEAATWALLIMKEPWVRYAAEIERLLAESDVLLDGTALLHLDLRDDNMIIDVNNQVWLCDWNFPGTGPVWVDLITIMIAMYGDGLDVETMINNSPLITAADCDAINCLLVLLLGYFTKAAARDEVDNSPYLRQHQAWYADTVAAWLLDRLSRPA